jgi:hypothetical protein
LFNEVSIILIPKLITREEKIKEGGGGEGERRKRRTQKVYRMISLMNIDTEILKKILAIRILQYIKSMQHLDELSIILGMQYYFHI